MTYTELVNVITTALPDASFGEDNDGQLIVYTNKKQSSSKDDDPLEDM